MFIYVRPLMLLLSLLGGLLTSFIPVAYASQDLQQKTLQGVDPNAPVPLEELIGAPFKFIIETWESAQPTPNLNPEVLTRAPAILEAIGRLTGQPGIDRLHIAITNRDERALGRSFNLTNTLARRAMC